MRKPQRKKCSGYMGFIDLKRAYNWFNREDLWQVLGTYDVGGKLFSGIKNM